jgi:hypothetical protein
MGNEFVIFEELREKYETAFGLGIMLSGLSLNNPRTITKLNKAMQKALDTGEPMPSPKVMWGIPDDADT